MKFERLRYVVSFFVLLGLLVPGLTAPVSAQSQTYTSQVTGLPITYSAPYTLDEESSSVESGVEIVMFFGSADIVGIGFLPAGIDLNTLRDAYLEGFLGEMTSSHQIDRGDYTGVSYSLDMVNIEGHEVAMFTLFMSDRAHGHSEFAVFIAPPALFTSTLQSAQSSISINGVQVFNGIDPVVMGNMVTENIGITGGETITDVTETQQEDPAPTEEAQPTEEVSTGGLSAEDQAKHEYMLAVGNEWVAVNDSLTRFLEALRDANNGTLSHEEAFGLMDTEATFLAQTRARADAITMPPGYEAFHAQYLEWADVVTAIGVDWQGVRAGTVSPEQLDASLKKLNDVHSQLSEAWKAESKNLPQPNEDAQPTTDATEVTTEAGDADAYVQAIQDHRGEFYAGLIRHDAAMSSLPEQPSQAEVQTAVTATNAEAELWVGFEAEAQALTPPPGYEDVHESYLKWASQVTALGNAWLGFTTDGSKTVDQYLDQLELTLAADADLESVLKAKGSSSEDVADTTVPAEEEEEDAATLGDDATEEAEPTEEAEAEPTEVVEESADSRSKLVKQKDSAETEAEEDEANNTSETKAGKRSSQTQAATEETGSSSEVAGSWTDPDTGIDVEWTDEFVADTETSVDHLMLDPGNGTFASVAVYPGTSGSAGDLLEAIATDPQNFERVFGADAELVFSDTTDERGVMLVRVEGTLDEYDWYYVELVCLDAECDFISYTILYGTETEMLDSVELLANGVTANGVPVAGMVERDVLEQNIEDFGN